MLVKWSLIKSWAKEHGYKSSRKKTTNLDNPNEYDYYWNKESDPTISGTAVSVSKLARDIYNHMTDNRFVEHQRKYRAKLSSQDVSHDTGFGI